MERWSDDTVLENLEELARMEPAEIRKRFDAPTRRRIEQHLALERRLRRVPPAVPLPADFAVRVAERAGVLRPMGRRLERSLVAVAVALLVVVWVMALAARRQDLVEPLHRLAGLAQDRSGALTLLVASCGALVAVGILDRWLIRRFRRR